MTTILRTIILAASTVLAGHAGLGADFKPEHIEFFEKRIRPLLTGNCYECHSASGEKIKGGLLLDSREAILKGGNTGPAASAGDPEKSLLIQAVRYTNPDLQMPPKHPLNSAQVNDLVEWVRLGLPDTRVPSTAGSAAVPSLEAGRKFWSFKPVIDPAPPAVVTDWPRHNVIDDFIQAKLEERNLAPQPTADKRTLLRRVTYDLTGLPPTPEEMRAFLADSSSGAFEQVVDRLLSSRHFGEQWGRHWLDVVRYADTSGCNSDYPVPDAYRYRNWVINAFNADKPYNTFLQEQLAGDLLPSASDAEKFDRIIATGYLAISRRFGSRASEFHLTLEDTIDNIGKGMMGLSLSCARCHDHKFDPVSTEDYYALYGILNSTRFAFPGTEIYKNPKDLVALTTPGQAAEINRMEAEIAELDDRIERLQEEKKAVERTIEIAANPGIKDEKPSEKPKRTVVDVKADLEDARTRQRMLINRMPRVPRAYAVAEGKIANARVQKKGEPHALGDEVPRRFLEVLGGQMLPASEKGSGRLELAGWIADPKNPLAARVMVNRIWQHLLGRGIVETPNDFGIRGKAPSHPELLDYLASRFIENGRSIKSIIRTIVLSHTYQQACNDDPAVIEADVDNQWFGRAWRQRLTAEEIRDSMLAASGQLDRTMGEAHPFPPSSEWRYTQHTPFYGSYETDRRSVYLMQQRIRKNPYLEIFDGADPNAPTGVRSSSTTPIQALFVMNNPFVEEQADQLAVRVGLAERDDAARINYASEIVFGRPATAEEIELGRQFLAGETAALMKTDIPADRRQRAALASFCKVLFSGNEFLFLD